MDAPGRVLSKGADLRNRKLIKLMNGVFLGRVERTHPHSENEARISIRLQLSTFCTEDYFILHFVFKMLWFL
jgi:hypothetical protein